MDLYKFGWDRAKEMSEQKENEEMYNSIEGLSGEEEALALATIQAEEDKEEHEHDRDAEDLEDESNIPEGYGDDGYIN